jgi:RNA polymerase sigma-70 factor (ECF subfamily)
MPLALSSPFSKIRSDSSKERLAAMFRAYYGLVWRVVRRFGASPSLADDAAQQVFVVAAERLADIAPASERAFLYGTAIRVAKSIRRRDARETVTDTVDERPSNFPGPEETVQQDRARKALDAVIAAMSEDTKAVFVLHELECLTMREIAEILELPSGTVASRLRRAREEFRESVAQLEVSRNGAKP